MSQKVEDADRRVARDLAEYDRFRYDNFPFRATHPDWLGTVGMLLGVDPPPTEARTCRVLELGCGRGGNLVGLAAALPEATFVGIDHAPSQVEDGRRDAAALGLKNCNFIAADIRDIDEGIGEYDFVICHGVFSWVPDDARDHILRLTRLVLAPSGIGFISFNAEPGWSARGIIREVLRRWVPEGSADEMALAARSVLELWRAHTPENGPLAGFLEHESDLLAKLSDHYLYFEHLVEHNHAYTLSAFVDLAEQFNLSYLGDADIASMTPAQLGDDGQAAIESLGLDPIATEQFLDDITIRFFRRALVCRDVDRPHPGHDHRRLKGAWVAGDMSIDELSVDLDRDDGVAIDMVLTDADGAVLRPDDPHTAALLWAVAEHRPAGRTVEDIAADAASRLGCDADEAFVDESIEILHALVLRGRLDAGRHHRAIASVIDDQPSTTALARFQATEERRIITTARHEHFAADRMDVVLLRSLDGTRSVADLLSEVRSAQASGELEVTIDDVEVDDPAVLSDLIEMKLERFVLAGLLVDTLQPSAS
jgi:SAM-dependent methyltransferase/methyltransferase-like protein